MKAVGYLLLSNKPTFRNILGIIILPRPRKPTALISASSKALETNLIGNFKKGSYLKILIFQ